HGIHHYQLGALFHLVDNTCLYSRYQVTQEQEFTFPEAFGYLRVEMLKYVQLSHQCIARVHIHMVAAAPEETLAVFHYFHTIEVDTTVLQLVNLLLWKV